MPPVSKIPATGHFSDNQYTYETLLGIYGTLKKDKKDKLFSGYRSGTSKTARILLIIIHSTKFKLKKLVYNLKWENGICQNWNLSESIFCHFLKKLEWDVSTSSAVRYKL